MSSGKKLLSPNGTQMLSAKKAARLLDCAPDYVSRLCREGKLEGTRHQGQWFVEPQSLKRFEAERNAARTVRAEELAQLRRSESLAYTYAHQSLPERIATRVKAGLPKFELGKPFAAALVASVVLGSMVFASTALMSPKQEALPAALARVESPFFSSSLFTFDELLRRVAALFAPKSVATAPAQSSGHLPTAPVVAVSSGTTTTAFGDTRVSNTNPVVERITERVVTHAADLSNYVTYDFLNLQLERVFDAISDSSGGGGGTVDFSDLTVADIPDLSSLYLSLSGGTLTGGLILTNATTSATSSLAGIKLSNLDCSGFNNGGVLTTDASGNVICDNDNSTAGSGSPGGNNTYVQYNDSGNFGGDAGFTYNASADRLTVVYASTTGITADYASTTNLVISGISASLLKTVNGVVSAAVAGTDYVTPSQIFSYPFPSNATSTTLTLSGGLLSGTSTIGSLTATSSVTFTGLTGGGLATDSGGTLYTYSTSTWRFASSTLLGDSNTFGGSNTFTNAPTLGSLSGLVGANSGTLYQIATSTNFVTSLAAGSGISLSGTTGAVTVTNTIGYPFPSNATTTLLAFNGGLTSASTTLTGPFVFANATGTNATTTNLAVTSTASTSALIISGITNGSTQCLQINGSGTVSGTGSACGAGAGVTQIGPAGQLQSGTTITFATSTNGTDFTITASGDTITFNLPIASASNTGKLTATDWTAFNNKVSSSSIDTSAELAALVTDETGSGALVFGTNASLTGTTLASTTLTGNFVFANATGTNATTTAFAITGIAGSLLKTTSGGSVVAAVAGTDYQAAGNYATFSYPFPSNATTTNIAFNGGLTAVGATTTALAVTGSSTVSTILNVGGQINANGGIVGALTGNASTATALETARTINGVSFDGTANITVTAASSTLLANSNTFSGLNTFSNLASASTTLTGPFVFANATGTNATTTNLAITGIASSLLKTNANGSIVAAVLGTDYQNFAYPFPSNATTTLIAFDGGLTSASTTLTGPFVFANATGTNATTTSLAISGALTFDGVTGTTWASFCSSITGSSDLCDGSDASGGGGGTDVNWTFFNGSGIRPSTSTNQVLVGATATSSLSAPLAKFGVVGGASLDSATTSALAVTGSTTISSILNVGGAINAASTLAISGAITSSATGANTLPYASSTALTVSGTGYFDTASTTNLTISGLGAGAGSCLTVNSSGVVSTQTCGNFAYPFPSNATTTLIAFNGGLTSASTTLTGPFVFANATGTNATTTNFAITGVTSSLLKTTANGSIVAAVLGTDYQNFGYPFPSNATTTLLAFNGGLTTAGLLSTASSTIVEGSASFEISNSGGIRLSQNGYQLFMGNNSFWNLAGTNPYLENGDENGIFEVRATGTNGAVALSGGPSGYVSISAGSAERVRVASGGNVGVGTTSPYAKLSVVGEVVGAYFTATTTATSTFPTLLSTNATTTNLAVTGITNSLLSTNALGSVVATSSVSVNYLDGVLPVAKGGTGSTTLGGLISGNGTSIYSSATGTVAASNGITVTVGQAIVGSGLTITGTDAAADGSTKGVAAFTAADFNDAAGVISIDYTNGQAASASAKGFLTAADWSLFNNKVSSSSIDTSAELAALVTDETGSGALVFGTNASLTGTTLASTTLTGNFVFANATGTNATTTNFAITGVTSSLLKTTANGSIVAAVLGTDYQNFGYPFPSNATTTLLAFNGGLTSASTTLTGPFVFANATGTNATTTSLAITGITSSLLSTNGNGSVVGTSSVSVNYLDGILPVAKGGTGASSFTAGSLLYGAGTGAVQTVATGTLSVGSSLTIDNSTRSLIGGSASISLNTGNANTWSALQTFNSGILVNSASSTVTNLSIGNSTTTNATTTNLSVASTASTTALVVSNLAQAGTQCVTTNSAGLLSLQTCANFSYPFPSNATTTLIAFNGGLTSASTTLTGPFVFANATGTNATTTSLAVSSVSNSLLSTSNGGVVGATIISSPLSFSGTTLSITQANSSTNGYLSSTDWSTFNNKISSSSLSATFPLAYNSSTGAFTFNGLSTSTAAVVGNIPYFSGANTFANVATSSLAIGSSLSVAGTLGYQIGGSASTISLNTANANSWSALQSFANSSTTLASVFGTAYFGGTSTTTISSTGSITLPSAALLTAPYASSTALTVSGTGYFGTASTTNLIVSGAPGGLLKTNSSGTVSVATAGSDYVNGSGASGNCVAWGSSNALTDAGAPCGSGSGSGDSNWTQINNSGVRLATTSHQVIIGAFATSSSSSKLEVYGGNILHVASGSPALAGSVSTSNNTYATVVSGNFAYTADLAGGLRIMNISNPASPALMGSLAYNGGSSAAVSLQVAGRYAYVGDSTLGLVIIDVSNPASSTVVSSTNLAGAPWGMALSGKYLYIADGDDLALKIVDVSNPAAPAVVGTYSTGALSQPYSVVVSGRYAYLGDIGQNRIDIVDISNPTSPVRTARYSSADSPVALYISGEYLHVADSGAGYYILDVGKPDATPTLVGTYDGAGSYYGVSVGNTYAYLANNNGTVRVVNIANPASPALIGSYNTGSTLLGLTVAGKYAYAAADTGGLKVVDINGASLPTATIGNLATNAANVGEDLTVGNNIFAGGGLDVGISGIFSRGTISAYIASSTDASPVVANFMGGNVGIGTTSPYARLSVAGQVVASYFTATSTTVASTFPYASSTALTVSGTGYFGTATTTNLFATFGTTTHATSTSLAISGIASSLLKTTSSGSIVAAVLGTDYQNFAYPFAGTGNSTSTLTQFNGGLTSYASTTIGAGGQTTGLTISGGATTTGNAYFAGGVGVGTSAPGGAIEVVSSGNTFPDGWNNNAKLTGAFPALWFNDTSSSNGYVIGQDSNNLHFLNVAADAADGYTLRLDGTNNAVAIGSGYAFAASVGGPTNGLIVQGNTGVGTTSPFSKLSVHANNGETNTTLFAIGSSTASATTTLFSISNTGSTTLAGISSSLLKVNSSGTIVAAVLGTDYQNFAYPFAGTGNSTSTLTQFNGGLTAYASSTIGGGTQTSGLTISGGATTTGNAYFGGNVGVGAATAAGKFHIAAAPFAGGANGQLVIQDNSASGLSASHFIAFTDSTGTSQAGIYREAATGVLSLLNYQNAPITFSTNGSDKLTITGLGNTGVGTTSPFSKLSVHANNGETNTTLFAIGSSTASATTTLFSISNTGSTTLAGISSSLLKVNSSGTIVAAVLGTDYQNFAYPFAGTGNSTSTLTQFNGGLTAYASSTIGAGGQTTGLTISGGATTTLNGYFGGSVGIGTSPVGYSLDVASRARISGTSGLVGNIGGNSYALSLQNNAVDTWLEILNNGGAGKGAFFGVTSNNFEQWNYQGGDILFYTAPTASNGSERLRITNQGRVGIGTSTPGTMLGVNGDAVLAGRVTGQYFTATSTATASSLPYASSTAITVSGTGYFDTASTTNLIVSALGSGAGNCLTPTSAGSITTTACANFSYPFPSNATSTLLTFSGGISVGGTLSVTGGRVDYSAAATSTIVNNTAYAWTLATSTTATPLINVTTTTGTETVTIGIAGSDVIIGGVGSAADLVFEESSVIHGQGGNTLTFGTTGDKINFAVNVGFGTTTPLAAIHADVTGTGDTAILGVGRNESYAGTVLGAASYRTANSGYYLFAGVSDYHGTPDNEFLMRGDGNGFLDGSWSTPADFAEWTRVVGQTEGYQPGDLVAFATSSASSSEPTDRRATLGIRGATPLGVVTLKPGMVGVSFDLSEDVTDAGTGSSSVKLVNTPSRTQLQMEEAYNAKMIALVGYTPIHVSTENGPLRSGDGITFSSIPGVGMKAEAGDVIVGYAFEEFDPEEGKMGTHDRALPTYDASTTFRPMTTATTTPEGDDIWHGWVFAHVEKGYVPALTLDDMLASSSERSAAEQAQVDSFWSGIFSKLAAWFGTAGNGIANLFATTIHAETINAKTLCLEDVCITRNELQALLNNAGQSGVEPPPDTGTTTPPVDDGNGTTTPPVVDEPIDGGSASSTPETPEPETPEPEPQVEPAPEPQPEPEPTPEPEPQAEPGPAEQSAEEPQP